MIEGKGQSAETVGEGTAGLQIREQESPEEEFLQQRIDEGYVQADIEKIIPVHTGIFRQIPGNAGEIHPSPQNAPSAQDQHKDAEAQAEGGGEALSPELKNPAEGDQFQLPGQQKGDQGKDC